MMEEIGLRYRGESKEGGTFEFGYSGYDSFYIRAKDGEFYMYRDGRGEIGQKYDREPTRFGIDEAAAAVEFCNYNFPNWEREELDRKARIRNFEKVKGRPFRPEYDDLDDDDYEPRMVEKVKYCRDAYSEWKTTELVPETLEEKEERENKEDIAAVWKQRGF